MADGPTIEWCEGCGAALCVRCQPDELLTCEGTGQPECSECAGECPACLAAEARDVASDAARHDGGRG